MPSLLTASNGEVRLEGASPPGPMEGLGSDEPGGKGGPARKAVRAVDAKLYMYCCASSPRRRFAQSEAALSGVPAFRFPLPPNGASSRRLV